jgi:hypothetical protein
MDETRPRVVTIYQLLCDDGAFYFGVTTQKNYRKRIGVHRHHSNQPTSHAFGRKVYKHIRAIGGWSHVTVNIVEQVPFSTKEAAAELERKYVVGNITNPMCLNTYHVVCTEEDRERQRAAKRIKTNERDARRKAVRDVPVLCDCGTQTTVGRQRQHLNSLKHRHAMETQ